MEWKYYSHITYLLDPHADSAHMTDSVVTKGVKQKAQYLQGLDRHMDSFSEEKRIDRKTNWISDKM